MPDGRNQGPPAGPETKSAAPDRAAMLDAVDSGIAARARGDKDAMRAFLAPDATFRIAGDPSLYPGFPGGPAKAANVLDELVDLIRFHDYERLDTLVEGNRAAIRWRIDVSLGGGPVRTTEVFDLWTFDGEGRITDLVQFVDTALLMRMLAERR
jgi:ketosteroid isomerase-like protein